MGRVGRDEMLVALGAKDIILDMEELFDGTGLVHSK